MERDNGNRQISRVLQCLICGSAFLVQFTGYGFYMGYGSIYVALQEKFHESNALTAWVGSLSYSLMFMLTPLTFKFYERLGYRISMIIGAVLMAISFVTSSMATNIYILYFTFGILLALGQSLCCFAPLLILPFYFKRNLSLAHSIALSGNSLGGLAQSPILGFIMKSYGFSKGMLLCNVLPIIIFANSMLFKTPGEGCRPSGKGKNVDEKRTTVREGGRFHLPLLNNKAFITYTICTVLFNFGIYTPYVHLVRLAMDVGISYPQAVMLPGIISLAQAIGKLSFGKIASMPKADKLVLNQTAAICMCLATTFVPTLTSFTGLAIYSFLFGISGGWVGASTLLVVRLLVGRKQFKKAYSIFLFFGCISFFAGPPFAGFLYTATGNYSTAFFTSGGLAAIGACCLFLVQYFHSQNIVDAQSYRKGDNSRPGQQIFSFMSHYYSPEPSTAVEECSKYSTRSQSMDSLFKDTVDNDEDDQEQNITKGQTSLTVMLKTDTTNKSSILKSNLELGTRKCLAFDGEDKSAVSGRETDL